MISISCLYIPRYIEPEPYYPEHRNEHRGADDGTWLDIDDVRGMLGCLLEDVKESGDDAHKTEAIIREYIALLNDTETGDR